MADVNRGNRPLSPHLMIYRPQLTSISSILVRITGNALIVAGILIVWWLLRLPHRLKYFAMADAVMTSWFGKLVMLGSIWALVSHAGRCAPFDWDNAVALDIPTAEKLGWTVVVGSFVLTAITVAVL